MSLKAFVTKFRDTHLGNSSIEDIRNDANTQHFAPAGEIPLEHISGKLEVNESTMNLITDRTKILGNLQDEIGTYVGPTLEDSDINQDASRSESSSESEFHPDLDWKPKALRTKHLLRGSFVGFVFGSVMIAMWYAATYHQSKVSTASSWLQWMIPIVLVFFALAWYEGCTAVDGSMRQISPYFRLCSQRDYPAEETILCPYYPDPPWNTLFIAFRWRHWLVVSTKLGTQLAAIIFAFQATLLGQKPVSTPTPMELSRPTNLEDSFVPFLDSSLGQEIIKAEVRRLASTGRREVYSAESDSFTGLEYTVVPFRNSRQVKEPEFDTIWSGRTDVIMSDLECLPAAIEDTVDGGLKIVDRFNCTNFISSSPQQGFAEIWWSRLNSSIPVSAGCADRQGFAYIAHSNDGPKSRLAISCGVSTYSGSSDIKVYGNRGSFLPSENGLVTYFLSHSTVYHSKTRVSSLAEVVIRETINKALFDQGLSESTYWFDTIDSQLLNHAMNHPKLRFQIDQATDGIAYPPRSTEDLRRICQRAYRSVSSRILYTAIRLSIGETGNELEMTTFSGTADQFPVLYTVIPQNALVLACAYYLLGIIGCFLAFRLASPEYAYTGLDDEPDTIMYHMLMVAKSRGLRTAFRGLEWTDGPGWVRGKAAIEGLVFKLGYWRVGNKIVQKLDCIGTEVLNEKRNRKLEQPRNMFSRVLQAAHDYLRIFVFWGSRKSQTLTQNMPFIENRRKLHARFDGQITWNQIPNAHLPIFLETYMHILVLGAILGVVISISIASNNNGPLPNWNIATAINSSAISSAGNLVLGDLIWRPLSSLITFLLFKVWIQNVLAHLITRQPFQDLAKGRSFELFFQSNKVEFWRIDGYKIFGSYDSYIMQWIIRFAYISAYVFMGLQNKMFEPALVPKVPSNQIFSKPPLVVSPELPPMGDALLSDYQLVQSGDWFPPFAMAVGYYSPIISDDPYIDSSGLRVLWSAETDFLSAGFMDCQPLNRTHIRYPKESRMIQGIRGVNHSPGQLVIPNCTLTSGNNIPLCPITSTPGSKLPKFGGGYTCGSWNLVQTDPSRPGDCPFQDFWHIHEVVFPPVQPQILQGGVVRVEDPEERSPITRDILCMPQFWKLPNTPVEIIGGSDRVSQANKTTKEVTEFLATEFEDRTKMFNDTEQSRFRREFNKQLSEAVNASAAVPDRFGIFRDIPSRLTWSLALQSESVTSRSIALRSTAILHSIYSVYLATTSVFGQSPIDSPANSEDMEKIEGIRYQDVQTVRINPTIAGLLFLTFLVMSVFCFPLPGWIKGYATPRSLDSIASYLSYFYTSPLLKEVEEGLDSQEFGTFWEAEAYLWNKWKEENPEAGYGFVVINPDGRSGDTTYTINRLL